MSQTFDGSPQPDKVVTLELEEGGLLPAEGARVLDQLFSQVLI
jgi:hypothetical protein